MSKFNYDLDFKKINFREQPDLYMVGKGEQGVLLVEPYKSEILPHWRFKTPEIAEKSSLAIYKLFLKYKSHQDFVGMDMARKFLQMGYTRSRRYANHTSGRKYVSNPQKEKLPTDQRKARQRILPQNKDWATNDKAVSASMFYEKYLLAKNDPEYQLLKKKHLGKKS
ncbi:MAG TPA: DUF4385 domain-containing protein [Vitreimonas sp.]|nr:DUF4385 domain-containing protein [Vitreimonas sp.]